MVAGDPFAQCLSPAGSEDSPGVPLSHSYRDSFQRGIALEINKIKGKVRALQNYLAGWPAQCSSFVIALAE